MKPAPFRSRTCRSVVLTSIVVMIALAGGAVVICCSRPHLPARFQVVRSGRVYRSAQPQTSELSALQHTLGLKTVICLRSEMTPEERAAEEDWCNLHGVRFLYEPVPSAQATAAQVNEVFSVLRDRACWPVLIHCRSGRHRTGMIVVCYRMACEGWTLSRARREMLEVGGRDACDRCDAFLHTFALGLSGPLPPQANGTAKQDTLSCFRQESGRSRPE